MLQPRLHEPQLSHLQNPLRSTLSSTTLKAILAKYAKSFPVSEAAVKNKRDYHLIVEKPLVIDGRKKDELWFASVIQQKHSVDFYFMPLYCYGKDGAKPSSEPMGQLDGKSCFHMTSLTPGQNRSINDALKVGLAA